MGDYRRPHYRIYFARLPRVDSPLPGIGHNGGPPLGDFKWPPGRALLWHSWSTAGDKAWKDVPRDVAIRRVRKAAELGLTYREYTLEILERGRYLSRSDAERIAEIKAARRAK